jgi:hypothetical protein
MSAQAAMPENAIVVDPTMPARNFRLLRGSSLLLKLFLWSAIIIIVNFLIGAFADVSGDAVDEKLFFDTLWRVVVGQRLGIDFLYPIGIGPYELGALLWHWLGPHNYIMRLAITLFNLSIAFCGCVVAERTLARRPNLALLFCVTLAFQLSAPTTGNGGLFELSLSEYYNRQIISALAVLILQTFAGGPISSNRQHASEVAVAAWLLSIMFFTKISGFVLGIMILFAGCLLPGRITYRLLSLCAVTLACAAIIAIELEATGLDFLALVHNYALAAHARLIFSLHQIITAMVSWPFLGSIALLVLFAASRGLGELSVDEFWSIALIIGIYIVCQHALNLTNWGDPNMELAPAALVSLAVCMSGKPAAQNKGGRESWWQRFAPLAVAKISVRKVILLLIFLIVLVPQIMSSIFGVYYGVSVSLGIKTPYVVTAGKAISFRSPVTDSLDRSLNDAIFAISSLNLGGEAIANFDIANPFPVLFSAPPPKGIQVFWELDMSVPRHAAQEWQNVIGDACVVTIPAQPFYPRTTHGMTDIARLKLANDFKLVYQDAWWSIYRRVKDCATAPS